jgi:bla regulator protein BlaR1
VNEIIGGLTNHLWQSTIFAIAAGLLTIAFRKAQVRFWLWFSASFKFLVPSSLLMSLGSHMHWASSTEKLATQLAMPAASFTIVQIAEPFSGALPIAAATMGARDWLPVAILVVWAFGFVALFAVSISGVASSARLPTLQHCDGHYCRGRGALVPRITGAWRSDCSIRSCCCRKESPTA